MEHITAGRAGVFDLADHPDLAVQTGAAAYVDAYDIDADLSDLELLATALHEALTAWHEGTLGGPGVDEAGLVRAARRARRRDASTLLRTQVGQLHQLRRAAA
jgi:hypothetical protein